MAALRPSGEQNSSASRKKIAKRTTNTLLFLLSVILGYQLCHRMILGYQKSASFYHAGTETTGSHSSTSSTKNRKATPGSGTAHRIHTLTTTNGSPYQNYQMRIAYASYLRMLKMPGGEHHVAFTRILHRTDRDEDILATEIPTFRADPLQPDCDHWCPYPVSDRANAVAQFWDYAKEYNVLDDIDWIYMIESDYVFVKPLLPPSIKLDRSKGYGYHFSYIQPSSAKFEMQKLFDGAPEDIPTTGPAPLLMSVENWLKVTPGWEDLAALIEADEGIKDRLGWVREMYGFDVALATAGIEMVLDYPIAESHPPAPVKFIRELPLHDNLDGAHAFHYTLPTIIKRVDNDEEVWSYDKRKFTDPKHVLRVPKVDKLPAWPGDGVLKWIEGPIVEKKKYELLGKMVEALNMAIEELDELKHA